MRTVLLLLTCLAFVSTGWTQDRVARQPDPVVQAALDDWSGPEFLRRYSDASIRMWEKSIQRLEEKDQAEADPADGILFIGSSSIRMWKNIADDVSPYRPIQRGYGGARYSDAAIYAERLIHPHQYRAMVVFVANDVTGRETDRTTDEVEELVRYIVSVSHQHQPDAPVLLTEITPTESRFGAWDKIRDVNARLKEIALTTPNTFFIPTAEHYLDPNGNPRPELFLKDKLHMNPDGYVIWGRLMRQRLDDVFRDIQGFKTRQRESEIARKATASVSQPGQ